MFWVQASMEQVKEWSCRPGGRGMPVSCAAPAVTTAPRKCGQRLDRPTPKPRSPDALGQHAVRLVACRGGNEQPS